MEAEILKELIKIFNCPICKEELEIVEKEKVEHGRLIDGTIACKGSPRHKFTVRRGIIFFSDELLPPPSNEEIEQALSASK